MSLMGNHLDLVLPAITFLLAFFLSLHLAYILKALAMRFGLLDAPSARKRQTAPVPCTGGVAIVIAFVASLVITGYLDSTKAGLDTAPLRAILGVGLGIAITGFLDDAFSVRAWIKLAVLAMGCLVLHHFGIGLARTPYPVLNFALTFLWVAGVSSAFNAIDNSDGLAGCIATISAVALFVLGWSSWQVCFSLLAMALAGSTLGFLHLNRKPAKLYMGDSGSFFLGYILSILVIYGQWSEDPIRSLLAGVLLLGLPIFDLGLTTLLRLRHGVVKSLAEAVAYSDCDHLSHRLLKLGLSHGQMLSSLCGLSCIFGVTALCIVYGNLWIIWLVLTISTVLLCAFAFLIDRHTSSVELWVNRHKEQFEGPPIASGVIE